MKWTADQVKLAAGLWADGITAAQIAVKLGGGISRNAVIGAMHRNGYQHKSPDRTGPDIAAYRARLERRNAAKRAQRAADGAEPRPAPPERLAAPVATPAPIEPPSGSGVRFRQLDDYHCRWPLNSKCDEGIWKSCGEPRADDGPYCKIHTRISSAGHSFKSATRSRRAQPMGA